MSCHQPFYLPLNAPSVTTVEGGGGLPSILAALVSAHVDHCVLTQVGSNGLALVPLKQGLEFESSECKKSVMGEFNHLFSQQELDSN